MAQLFGLVDDDDDNDDDDDDYYCYYLYLPKKVLLIVLFITIRHVIVLFIDSIIYSDRWGETNPKHNQT